MIALVLAVALSAQADISSGSPPALVVFTERYCYGPCPDYRMAIFPSDEYVMCGFIAVNQPGVSVGQLTPETFSAAADLVMRSGLLDEESVVPGGQECAVQTTDFPGMKIELINEDGGYRAFEWYAGCHADDDRIGETARRAERLQADIRAAIQFDQLVQSPETRDGVTRDQLWRPQMSPEDCPITHPASEIIE